MRQRWDDLFFFHWRVDATEVQRRLPRGLTVDLFEGEAYLGIVGFRMNAVRPAGLPALPWLSHYQRTERALLRPRRRGRAGRLVRIARLRPLARRPHRPDFSSGCPIATRV